MKTNTPAQASWATFTLFLLHGIMVGSWVPHIPLAKERLDVGPGVFGLALLAIAAGAVTAMPLTGAMINRYGSSRVALVTGILFCLAFTGPGHLANARALCHHGLPSRRFHRQHGCCHECPWHRG